MSQKLAGKIAAVLRKEGYTALLAGGCVRDLLLGRTPKDFDIATNARPEEVQRIFPHTVPVGAQFGVILVVEQGQSFEVATFRADGAYIDGRRPESVVFSSPEEDAARRDFTINGMFLDPATNEVLDFVGGRADMDRRVVRAIGDAPARFSEDKLRMLRAIRFSAELGFAIDPATWDALQKSASEIHSVSAERIRDEFFKILAGPQRVIGFDLLDASGLLKEILPEVEALKGCEQPPQFHPEGDVFVHTRIMLELLPDEVSTPLVLAVLFHDIGKPPTFARDADGRIRFNGHEHVSAEMTNAILRRLRCSNELIDATVEMVRNHMAFKDVQHMRVATLKRFLSRDTIEDELELHRVDCASSHGMLDNYEFLHRRREEFANEPLAPTPLLTGRDLIALGLKPGPQFKSILHDAMTRQLEGEFPSREDALQWLASAYRPDAAPPSGG